MVWASAVHAMSASVYVLHTRPDVGRENVYYILQKFNEYFAVIPGAQHVKPVIVTMATTWPSNQGWGWFGSYYIGLACCLLIGNAGVTMGCRGRKVFNETSGMISDGTGKYPEATHCEWLIQG